jgi:hypothetical protein
MTEDAKGRGPRGVAAAAVLGLFVATGLAAGGYLMGLAVSKLRSADRYVTVKGFAEREVPANLAIWPLVYNAVGNDLGRVQTELDAEARTIRQFLAARGFAEAELALSAPRVTDFEAQGTSRERPVNRYMAEATATLRTADVSGVRAAMQESAELVKQGVTLLRSYEDQPLFLYTELDTIKPAMIAEATVDARRAAEQFAKDSGSRVGAIRSAQQGYFQIEDRDPHTPEFKKIRVVTTIQYFLED